MKNNKKKNDIFIIVLLGIVIVSVFFFPLVYSHIENSKLPKINNSNKNNSTETKEVDEETLEGIHYPLMRNSIYDSNTYYSLNEFTISNMSNKDILLNAFLDMYEGNITNLNVKGTCINTSKQFNSDYIELRIKNILGKNVNYTLDDFYVPEDSNSNFKGDWSYDKSNSRFIYNGLCESKENQIKYYNLEHFIKAEYDNRDIIVYKYIGFAKVDGNNYIIYKDANMTQELSTGTINNVEELNSIFENLNNSDKNIYKYTFKDNLCSYNEYCLYKGEWTNEL